MAIRLSEVVCAKLKDRWVKLNVNAIQESMKKIFQATKKKDLNLALMNVRDFYKDNKVLQEEAGFISKLLQLEASGYVEPPLNLGRMYQEIVKSMSNREENAP